jgi:hypothetical protein
MRCLNQPDLSRKKITGPALLLFDVHLDFWTSPVAAAIEGGQPPESMATKNCVKIGVTPDDRKAKERILESAEML